MSRKAAGRRETRSHDTSDPSLEYRDQTLYLYTFETIKKYYYTSLTDTAYTVLAILKLRKYTIQHTVFKILCFPSQDSSGG